MTTIGYILMVILGIGLLIGVHEFGHYLCARLIGARVEVFALGFGPRVFGRRIGPTDYRLALIPIGGYVQVAGQDPDDMRFPDEQCLWSKSVGQRMLFYLGGVVMNLLFALVAFPLVFSAGVSFEAPIVGAVLPGSAAWEARLEPRDRILALNGKAIQTYENLYTEVALAGHQPVTLLVRRGDQEFTVTARPQYDQADGIYQLGIDKAFQDGPPPLLIDPNGPAASAGLRTGDVLLAVDGKNVVGPDREQGVTRLSPRDPQPVALLIRRPEGESTITVTPAPGPDKEPMRIGVMPIRRIVTGLRAGLPLVDELGLQRGDVLLGVDGRPYLGKPLAEVLAAGSGPVRLLVRRGQQELQVAAHSDAGRRELAEQIGLGFDQASLMLVPTPDDPAIGAGMLTGDRLLAIDDHPITTYDDLRRTIERGSSDRPFTIAVARLPEDAWTGSAPEPAGVWDSERGTFRGAQRTVLTVQGRQRVNYTLGMRRELTSEQVEIRANSFGDALRIGAVCSVDLIKQIYVILKRLFTGDVAAKNLSGVVGISNASYQFAKTGPSRFFYWLALLSLNLAFLNVLPIPVLDGGHLLFLVVEKIKGSPVNTKVLAYSQVLGLIFVLALVVFVTYNDIRRLL